MTFGYRLNSVVQVEKIDVVDLSFKNDRFLFVSQVMKFSKFGFMFCVKLLMLVPGAVMAISYACVLFLTLLFSGLGI